LEELILKRPTVSHVDGALYRQFLQQQISARKVSVARSRVQEIQSALTDERLEVDDRKMDVDV
jgi:hypothetical protein